VEYLVKMNKNMKKIRNWIAALLFVASAGGATLTVATPQTAFAAANCDAYLLTFPAWYNGLTDANCNIQGPTDLPNFIWKIALNLLEICLQLVGYISVGFIIKGGFKYMTSAGSPDGISKARTTILNAVIGLGISIFSVAIVNLVARSV
jgi:TRAP-type C4-dicarboxylate transport system permease small subunit